MNKGALSRRFRKRGQFGKTCFQMIQNLNTVLNHMAIRRQQLGYAMGALGRSDVIAEAALAGQTLNEGNTLFAQIAA